MTTSPDPHIATLLRLADEGATVAQISQRLPLSPAQIYSALREHRPDRQRSPRRRTSERVPMVLGLLAQGIKPARVAALAGVARQYVYRIAKESVDSKPQT